MKGSFYAVGVEEALGAAVFLSRRTALRSAMDYGYARVSSRLAGAGVIQANLDLAATTI